MNRIPAIILSILLLNISAFSFPSFGAQLEGASQASGKYTYTGKEQDQGSGLYYYGARYYDARLGQFTQADSLIPEPYRPQSLNRYAYVINNPFKYTDPTGHWLDSFIDMVSLSNDIEDLRKEQNIVNILAVAADLGTLALPGFVAGGTILKKGINGADMITRSEDVLKVSNNVDTAADAAKGAKIGDKVADVSKQSSEFDEYAKFTKDSATHTESRHLDLGKLELKSNWFPGTDVSKMSTEIQSKGSSYTAKNGYKVVDANLGRPVGWTPLAKNSGGIMQVSGGRVVINSITNIVKTTYPMPVSNLICRR